MRARARLGAVTRLVGWGLLGTGAMLWVQGVVWPAGGAVGPFGVASVGGYLALAEGTQPVRCAFVDRASRGWPQWQLGTARFVVAPERRWMPCTSTATMTTGAATSRTSVLWVPSWCMVAGGALLLGAGVVLGRRRGAGECPACGYSKVGLAAGAACPECGAGEHAKEARC